MEGAAAMVMLSEAVAIWLCASVTFAVKLNVPLAEAGPEMAPVT